jgi:YtkA-like
VSFRVRHRVWVWVAAGFVALISGGAVLGASASPDRRAALLSQLQHPARVSAAQASASVPQIRAHHGRARLTLAGRAYLMHLSPNLASARNRLALTVTANGRPLVGATVTAVFSMPAMNMWHAFSLSLTPTAGHAYAYASMMPFVGMPGEWRLDVRVALPGRHPAVFAVADVLGS